MSKPRVVMTVTDGVSDVRFNRPDKLNALDEAQFRAVGATVSSCWVRGGRCGSKQMRAGLQGLGALLASRPRNAAISANGCSIMI